MVLGLILFNIFIKDVDDRNECLLTKFMDHTKLGGGVLYTRRNSHHAERPSQARRQGQQRLHKCNVLHMRENNPKQQYKLDGL